MKWRWMWLGVLCTTLGAAENNPLKELVELKVEAGQLTVGQEYDCRNVAKEVAARLNVEEVLQNSHQVDWKQFKNARPAAREWGKAHDEAWSEFRSIYSQVAAAEQSSFFGRYNLLELEGVRKLFGAVVIDGDKLASLSAGQFLTAAQSERAPTWTYSLAQKKAILETLRRATKHIVVDPNPLLKRVDRLAQTLYFSAEPVPAVAAEAREFSENHAQIGLKLNTVALQSFCFAERFPDYAKFVLTCPGEAEIYRTFSANPDVLENDDFIVKANCHESVKRTYRRLYPKLHPRLLELTNKYRWVVHPGIGPHGIEVDESFIDQSERCLKNLPPRFAGLLTTTRVMLSKAPALEAGSSPGAFYPQDNALILQRGNLPESFTCSVIIHEVAHVWKFAQDPEMETKWRERNHYQSLRYPNGDEGHEFVVDIGEEMISAYGRSQLNEDIAESVTAAILYPYYAADRSPRRLKFLEDEFGQSALFDGPESDYRQNFLQRGIKAAMDHIKAHPDIDPTNEHYRHLVMAGPEFFADWLPRLFSHQDSTVRLTALLILQEWQHPFVIDHLNDRLEKDGDREIRRVAARLLLNQGNDGEARLLKTKKETKSADVRDAIEDAMKVKPGL